LTIAPPAISWSTITELEWTAPIVVEALFPERTKGGVTAQGGRIAVDLSYGIELRTARKSSGDFRMGALALVELSELQRGEYKIDKADPLVVLADAEGRASMAAEDDSGGNSSFEAGNNFLASGDLHGAEAAFRRADERGHAAAAVNLGNLRKLAGDLDGAQAAFRRAEQRGNSNGTVNLGVLFLDRGDLQGAEAAFRRADQHGNSTAPAYLGVSLDEQGDLAGAEAAYRRADARGSAPGAFGLVHVAPAPVHRTLW
jgi:tetratricopeptide (TPR) repeat protein